MENPLLIAGLIDVIISALKNWKIKKKYYPIVSVFLGLSYYLYWVFQGECLLILAIQNSIISAGVAMGTYSGIKTVSGNSSVVKKIMNPLTLKKRKQK